MQPLGNLGWCLDIGPMDHPFEWCFVWFPSYYTFPAVVQHLWLLQNTRKETVCNKLFSEGCMQIIIEKISMLILWYIFIWAYTISTFTLFSFSVYTQIKPQPSLNLNTFTTLALSVFPCLWETAPYIRW